MNSAASRIIQVGIAACPVPGRETATAACVVRHRIPAAASRLLEVSAIRHRAHASLTCLMLTLMLVLTACSGGTAPDDGAPGAGDSPPVEPSPSDPTLDDPDLAAGDDPGPESESAAYPAPARPARAELIVHAEQVEVTLSFVLIHAPELGFSTYLFEDFGVESTGDSASGLRVSDPDRPSFIEVTPFVDGTTEEAALAALHEAASADDAWVQPGVPVRPWAVDSVLVDHGDHADVYHLLEHAGRYLLMRQHFAWVDADGFAPVLEGFLNEWLWDNGEYLVPR